MLFSSDTAFSLCSVLHRPRQGFGGGGGSAVSVLRLRRREVPARSSS